MMTDDRRDGPPEHDRLRTGIPGLDRILAGGLLRGRLYGLAGPSGAGKTVLANQIAHEAAARGERTVYLTLMTESHARMLDNLRSLSFFDPSRAGEEVLYVSGYGPLLDGGLGRLLDTIDGEMSRRKPSLLVLDGIYSDTMATASTTSFREFLNRLRAIIEIRGGTGLITLRDESREQALFPLSDGLILLSHSVEGARAVRRLRVQKYRGSGHLGGEHEFVIDEGGVDVYPRMEARPRFVRSEAPPTSERRSFGVEGLDRMLGGGLGSASAAEILGAPGSGKTLLGLSFLCAGADQGERGLYLGLYETPDALVTHAEGIGLPLGRHRDSGQVGMVWCPASEGSIDRMLNDLLERVERDDLHRVVIDGYDGLRQAAAFPERVTGALAAANHVLRGRGATVLVTVEAPVIGPPIIPPQPTSALVENAIALRYAEVDSSLRRLVSIIKVRGSAYDPTIREVRITSAGIQVLDAFDDTEGILSGQPHRPGGRRR